MNLELFNYNDTTVRVVEIEDEPWFVLTDLCKVLGIANQRNVAARLSEDVKGVHSIDTPGGVQQMTIVNEAGMYEVILRSDKPEAFAFRRWVTTEVLPSIRKTGQYGQPELTPGEIMARGLIEAQKLLEASQKELAEARPKVMFANSVASSPDLILVRDLAKLLTQNGVRVGATRLYEWLRRDGYLLTQGSSYNRPSQKAAERGLFKVVETTIHRADGEPMLSFTTKVTGAGQLFFLNKYAKALQTA